MYLLIRARDRVSRKGRGWRNFSAGCASREWIVPLIAFLVLQLTLPQATSAHERRKVGALNFVVGWYDEPAYVGFKNGVQLSVRDASGKPVENISDGVKVEVIFGDQKMGPLELHPAFGSPGEYRAQIIPTRAGAYTFRFVGSVKGQQINESFRCSEKTFDCPPNAADVEFPAKDPSRAELAGRIERLNPRMQAVLGSAMKASETSALARNLAIAAMVVAAVGLVVGFAAIRGRATS